MSFDLFFVSRSIGGLEPAKHDALLALRRVAAAHGGGVEETFWLKFPDETFLEFRCDADGGMLPLRRWDEQRAAVIFDILKETDWLAVSPQEPFILVSCAAVENPSSFLGHEQYVHHVVGSAQELFAALNASFEGWRDYRNKVVEGH